MIQNIRIMPCNNFFCKCVEYLNFSKSKDLNKYKNCYFNITRNNLKNLSNKQIDKYEKKYYTSK
jgi:hypothetical protein